MRTYKEAIYDYVRTKSNKTVTLGWIWRYWCNDNENSFLTIISCPEYEEVLTFDPGPPYIMSNTLFNKLYHYSDPQEDSQLTLLYCNQNRSEE